MAGAASGRNLLHLKSPLEAALDAVAAAEATNSVEDDYIKGHPAYQVLYADNINNQVNFALFAKPLSFEDLSKNKNYVSMIVASEPGPLVKYQELPAFIRDVRLLSKTGNNSVANFLERLLDLHNEWLVAALQYHSFNIFSHMLNGFFRHRSSPTLLALENGMSSSARAIIASHRSRLSTPEAKAQLSLEWDHHHNTYQILSQRLHAAKTSPSFHATFAHLHEMQPLISRTVVSARKLSSEMQTHRNARKSAVKARNLSHAQWAMGNQGTLAMMDDAEDALEEAMEELNEEHFEMKEEDMEVGKWRWLREDSKGRERVVDGKGRVVMKRKPVQGGKGREQEQANLTL